MPDALVERDGPLMIVTMNRPHRMNAQSPAMLVRMYDAWVEASADDEIRCIIVTGADGNFSSGADLKAMAGDSGPNADTEIDHAARLAEDPRLMHKAYLKHYRPTKPIIAAVEGVAIAGGTEIAARHRHPRGRRVGPVRRVGSPVVALPDDGVVGAAARVRSRRRSPPRSC